MIILRKLFSSENDINANEDAGSLKTAAGIGSVLVGKKVVRKFHEKHIDKVLEADKTLSTKLKDENKTLLEKLEKEATKQGTLIKTPKRAAKDLSDTFGKGLDEVLKKSVKDNKKRKETVKKSKEVYKKFIYDKLQGAGPNYSYITDTVHIDPKDKLGNNAATLAHELGHSKHYHGRDGSKLGKLAHKFPRQGLRVASMGAGFASGYKAEKDREKGKKVSTLNKLTPALVAAGTYAPVLSAEGAASKRGIKELKKLGASNEYIKHSKKDLRNALGTYVATGAKNIVLGYGGREAGKIARKMQRHKEEKKNNKQY